MTKFRRPVVVILLVVAISLVTSSCAGWLQSKEQQAFTACYAQVKSEQEEEFLIEDLVGFLDEKPRDTWPLQCQKWALLIENIEIDQQIAQLEKDKENNQAEIDRIDDQIAEQNKAEAKAAESATAQALTAQAPTPTPTPTPTPDPNAITAPTSP